MSENNESISQDELDGHVSADTYLDPQAVRLVMFGEDGHQEIKSLSPAAALELGERLIELARLAALA